MEKTQSRNSASMLLALILFLSSGALLRFADADLSLMPLPWHQQSEMGQMRQQLHTSVKDLETRLNQHLQETNHAIEQDHFHRVIETNAALEGRGGDLHPLPQSGNEPLPLEPLGDAVVNNGNNVVTHATVTPESIAQEELAYRQFRQRQLAEYRKEYIRQYVENARSQGWKVDVNDKGQVTQVTPLPAHRPTIPFDDPVANSEH